MQPLWWQGPGIAARLIPEARARGRAKARTARVALNNRPRGVPGTPSFASTATRKGHTAKECWKKKRDRSANCVDQDACNVDCMGFDMASLQVQKAVAPRDAGLTDGQALRFVQQPCQGCALMQSPS